MSISFIFWLLMLLALVFHLGGFWGPYAGNPGYMRFNWLWLWVLLFLLGWATFGFIIRG